MIQGVIDGKYDGVIDSVSVTEKRREVIDFSLPYTTGGSTFVVLKDSGIELPGSGSSVDLADDAATQPAMAGIAKVLAGKTVGVQVSTIQSTFLTKYLADKGVTVRTYPNGPDVYHDLLNGRIDAAWLPRRMSPRSLKRMPTKPRRQGLDQGRRDGYRRCHRHSQGQSGLAAEARQGAEVDV